MNLSELKTGQKALIKKIKTIDASLHHRLVSIGFTPGCELCMKRSPFLNGPCILECRGQCFSIRKSEAEQIEVIR